MSWKLEVQTYSCPPDAWSSNALRFATKEECDAYGQHLMMRWLSVKEMRSTETGEPVSHHFEEGKLSDVEDLG